MVNGGALPGHDCGERSCTRCNYARTCESKDDGGCIMTQITNVVNMGVEGIKY
jgi:hypothetical protein